MNIFRITAVVGLLLFLINCQTGNRGQRYISVVEGTAIQVPAMIGGRIAAMAVQTGEDVKAGDTLAIIDTTDLHLNRRELQAALAELDIREQIARTTVRARKTDYDYVRQRFERIQALFQNESVPRQQLDDAYNRLQGAESAFQTARQNLQRIQAERQRLMARLAILEKKLRDAIIRAPVSGTIVTRYFEQGEAVAPMQPIVEIIDLSMMRAKIYVSVRQLPGIRTGQRARVFVDGIDTPLSASVEWISARAEFTPKNILTPETRTSLVYAVRVLIPNPERILKHGMPVEIELEE
ncbi:MAG: efflux RND transporter periplasmic adaptor subunit [Calditrichaeota bacterium]|nr:efflux RND transporter periplasmic adaptor subunit [Calditrichota bacterium]